MTRYADDLGLRRAAIHPSRSATPAAHRRGEAEHVVDIANLEHAIREDLNLRAPRVMAVLNPLKVVIENYPAGQSEEVDVINNPEDPSAGTRKVRFGRELYIERDDFMENPPKKFFRLSPGNEFGFVGRFFSDARINNVRAGRLRLPRPRSRTLGGDSPDGRRCSTLHWVSARLPD